MNSPVTVTGCIAKGDEAGHYVLTNAVLTPETAPEQAEDAASPATSDKIGGSNFATR